MLFNLDKLLALDVETDALFGYTTIHCIVATDYRTGEEHTFEEPTKNPYVRKRLFQLVRDRPVAGNNFIGFDIRALRDLLPGIPIRPENILDTLVVSRLLNYNKLGGHSLENWGITLGVKKEGADIKDWSRYTPLMLTRCKSDVQITIGQVQRMERFLTDPAWELPIWTEHKVAWMCNTMTRNGLPFDREGAHSLLAMLQERMQPIMEALATDFPPKPKVIRTITPRMTQKGTLNAQDFRWARTREFVYDPASATVLLGSTVPDRDPDLSAFGSDPFQLVELIPFNPGSPIQVVERLNEAGWKPTEKTKGHLDALKDQRRNRKADPATKARLEHFSRVGWKVSEENLKTLPDTAPESAKKLAQRLVLSSRISDLEEWIALTQMDGRIHGNYNGIGAWTHRLSHNSPNTANIPVAKRAKTDTEFQKFTNDINDAMRALFIAPPGYRLLGTDADGIQMRIFAHLVGDEKLINALITGSKEDGTDIHSVHKTALGTVCKSRDAAKTFIYAFLLGAGVAKVAEILECNVKQAKEAVDNFLRFYPGLKHLKDKVIPNDAARGYFIGLDGRKVACDSEHLMLSGYLQNGEKIIMAMCGVYWMEKLEELGIPYELLNWVHDEWQVMIPDSDEIAKKVTDIQLESFLVVTEQLKMRCPLAGTTSTHDGFIGGYSWKETH